METVMKTVCQGSQYRVTKLGGFLVLEDKKSKELEAMTLDGTMHTFADRMTYRAFKSAFEHVRKARKMFVHDPTENKVRRLRRTIGANHVVNGMNDVQS